MMCVKYKSSFIILFLKKPQDPDSFCPESLEENQTRINRLREERETAGIVFEGVMIR